MTKILQIIPAPGKLEALFEEAEGTGSGSPIVCFALTEDEHKQRKVRPMYMDMFGGVFFPEDEENYIGVSVGRCCG